MQNLLFFNGPHCQLFAEKLIPLLPNPTGVEGRHVLCRGKTEWKECSDPMALKQTFLHLNSSRVQQPEMQRPGESDVPPTCELVPGHSDVLSYPSCLL